MFTQKKVEQGLAYFELITKTYWIEPGIEIYGFLIDLLMKIEPDDVVWGSLFDGCKIHHGTDLAQFAVKILIEIDNMIYSIMLVNLYGELGKWDEVSKVRKMFKRLVMPIKKPGRSWIVADKQLRFFDKTHPRTEEICDALDNLDALN